MLNNEDVLIFISMLCVIVVQQISSSKFQLNDESFVLLFHNTLIP